MSAVEVSVISAAEKSRPVLARLAQLYLHDLSTIGGWDVGEDGLFENNLLDGCWSTPRRHPYLIHADDTVAGFAIVDRGSHLSSDQQVWDMAEFFVLRRWRRSGVGRAAATQLFALYPGTWEIRPFANSRPALGFWESTCSAITSGEVEIGSYRRSTGGDRPVLRITTDNFVSQD